MTSNPYQAPATRVQDVGAAVPHSRSLWLGVLAASVMPVVCVAIPMGVLTAPAPHFSFSGLLAIVVMGLMLTVPATVMVGLPFVWLLRWRGWLSAGAVCLAAVLVGAVVGGMLMGWPPDLMSDDGPMSGDLGEGLMLGIGSGLSAGLGMVFGAGIPFSRRRGRAPA